MHAFRMAERHHIPVLIQPFGEMIRGRRLALGYSRARAATLTGISVDLWRGFEHGEVPTGDPGLVRAIAGTLELSFDALSGLIAELEIHFEDCAEPAESD